MASIRIRNKADSGGIPGLTRGELAVNLADRVLWVGGTTDTPIYLSGVQTFNGLTGAVTGVTVGGVNVFTQLNRFEAGISASGATLGTLVVNGGISAAGGITFNSLSHFTQGLSAASLSRFNEITVNNTALFNSPIIAYGGLAMITGKTTLFDLEVSAGAGITFNSLSHFTQGLSGSGATLGRLVVNSGISASGGVTFHNNVWVGGLLTANGGISAAGGVTFENTVYVGQTLSLGGNLVKNGAVQYLIQSVGTTSDLRYLQGVTTGSVVFVSQTNYDGLYVLRLVGSTPLWSRVNGNLPADINGDGVVDGIDLAGVLAAFGATTGVYSWSGTPLQMGISDNKSDAFEIKVFGVATGKKSSAFRITSNEAVPQIFMKAGTVDVDGGIKVVDYTTGVDQVALIQGSYFANYPILRVRAENVSGTTVGGWSEFICGVCFAGGITFNGPVYMGATLTMNSNIRFNSGFGIGGFVDGGTYN